MNQYGYTVMPTKESKVPIIYGIDSVGITNGSKHSYAMDIETFNNAISIELIEAYIPNPDDDNYIILRVNDYQIVKGNTNSIEGCFCILIKNSDGVFSYNKTLQKNNPVYTKFFNQPQKVGRIKIDFVRPEGSVPSFGTSDHILVFEINATHQPQMSSDRYENERHIV
jgi:hypothetical protein